MSLPDNPERRRALSLMFSSFAAAYCATATFSAFGTPGGSANRQQVVSHPSLTRAAVVHDALTLLATDRDVTGEWQSALMPFPSVKPYEYSYAYGAASLGSEVALLRDIVTDVRDGWSGRDKRYQDIQRYKGDMLELRFAIALGFAANHGASRVLYKTREDSSENALAYDAELLRALTGKRRIAKKEAQRRLRLLYERTFVGMHTVEPDLDDIDGYLDRYIAWVEKMPKEIEKLAEALASSPPRGMPTAKAFYNPGDAVIAVVENLRQGAGVPNKPRSWTDATGSLYAMAVVGAYGNARWVLDAARGDATIDAMMSAIQSV